MKFTIEFDMKPIEGQERLDYSKVADAIVESTKVIAKSHGWDALYRWSYDDEAFVERKWNT